MHITLVRHFRVDHDKPARFMSSEEFETWVNHYDGADIIQPEGLSMMDFEMCLSSDLPRARDTARELCSCPVTETPLLREVPLVPFFRTAMKLPFPLWNAGGRLLWFFTQKFQPEPIKQTVRRAEDCIAMLESAGKNNILVVSHGFFLMVLAICLEKRGYTGKKTRRFKHGEMVFYKKEGKR
ncbi:MAG TPA: histidine phosphatase family protein [Bacillaceae bacterium]